MKFVSILAALMIVLFVGAAAGAIITEHLNSTAEATTTLEKPHNNDIETLVSDDGVNFSENIIINNISAGDEIVLTFSHENTMSTRLLYGMVEYEVECIDGLDYADGPCKGSINDFYNDNLYSILPGGGGPNMPHPNCINSEYGIIHENTYGNVYPVNSKEYVIKIDDNVAQILPTDYQIFDGVKFSVLTITFNDDAYGTYKIRGTVNTMIYDRIPIADQKIIEEFINT